MRWTDTRASLENVDLLLVGGPQGSGKSSLATHWFRDRKRVNRDSIREFYVQMTQGEAWRADHWTPDMEPLITEIENAVLRKELREGNRVVVDNTHINKDLRQPYIELAHELGKTIGCVFLALPLDYCLEKNQARDRTIPDQILAEYYKSMELPRPTEGLDLVQVVNEPVPLN